MSIVSFYHTGHISEPTMKQTCLKVIVSGPISFLILDGLSIGSDVVINDLLSTGTTLPFLHSRLSECK
jgi:hypothetical protein